MDSLSARHKQRRLIQSQYIFICLILAFNFARLTCPTCDNVYIAQKRTKGREFVETAGFKTSLRCREIGFVTVEIELGVLQSRKPFILH